MTDAESTARYILQHVHSQCGNGWLSGPRSHSHGTQTAVSQNSNWLKEQFDFQLSRRQKERLNKTFDIRQLFQMHYLRGIVLDSHEGLVGWLEDRYPLVLRHDIPLPVEMLEVQCEGKRIVTVFTEPKAQLQSYGRHKNACAFTLHDLEHAHKFFGDINSFNGQRRFFKCLRQALPTLLEWGQDAQYRRELEYLMADMNSHPLHLLKYLKAIVLSAKIRQTAERFPNLETQFATLWTLWDMPSAVVESAQRLNQPEQESATDRQTLTDFFMRPSITTREVHCV